MSVTPLHYDDRPPAPPARRGPEAVLALADDYWRLANRVAATEFVPKELRNRPEAVVAALLSGAERGLGPMESLRSISVIEGRPSLSAEAKRALVLAAGHEIAIVESTATRCTVLGRRAGDDKTTSFTWTIDRARRANLVNKDNWRKYPESMLLARASSELCNAVFPDITAGLATTEEVADELAAERATARRSPPRRLAAPPTAEPVGIAGPAAPPAAAPAPVETTATSTVESPPPMSPPEIPGADRPSWGAAAEPAAADPALGRRIHAEIAQAFPDADNPTRDRWRHALVAVVTRRRDAGPATSSSDLDLEEQLALSKLLVNITAGRATVADGPDNTIELRAGGGWRYTVSLDPPAVAVSQGDVIDSTAGDDPAPAANLPLDEGET